MNRLITRTAALAAELFYKLDDLGAELPERGPLILVGNHPNGLVDPILLVRRTRRRVRFLAKAPLFSMPVLGFFVRQMGALPVYRRQDGADTQQNELLFAAVFEALHAGDAVCLFPEGESHSSPSLQTLRTGAARMALGAEERTGFTCGVRIVPVGLVYRRKDTYRSPAATWVGEPIEVADLSELYGRDERAAVQELTERIAGGLKRVTIQLADWQDLPLLRLANRLWRDGPEPGTGGSVPRLALLADALAELRRRDPERARDLTARASAFQRLLRRLDLSLNDLHESYAPLPVLRFALRNGLLALLGLPLGLVGFALWCVPYYLVRLPAALGSVPDDIAATVKLIASLIFFPAWFAVLVGAAWLGYGPLPALAVLVLAPPLGPLSAAYWERLGRALEESRVFLRLAGQQQLRSRLIRYRDELAAEIEAASRALAAEEGPTGV